MKTLLKYFLLTLFLFSNYVNPNAQPSITWQKLYNSSYNDYESGRDVCQTTDGNFVITGVIYIGGINRQLIVLKINQFGDTLWLRVILNNQIRGGNCCFPTNDGGCIITGDGTSNFAIRINKDGSTKWIKFYGVINTVNYDIRKLDNGGYIFCGRDINRKGIITKIDSFGELIWERRISSGYFTEFRAVFNVKDNGNLIIGTVLNSLYDTSKIIIIRIDSAGNSIWEKKHTVFSFSTSLLNADLLENGYLLGGTCTDSNSSSQGSSFLSKIDFDGNIIFSKIFYTTNQEYFYDIKKINNNRYVMAVTVQELNLNAKTYITDSLGNILLQKVYINNLFSSFRSVLPLFNGDILMVGIYEFGLSFPQNDIYVVRTDSLFHSPPLSVKQNLFISPSEFILYQNYPNPFNTSTTIVFEIENSTNITLNVFDIRGKKIVTLINDFLSRNKYKKIFNGNGLSSGIYLFQLSMNNVIQESKCMLLLK